jgi:hypothetical protein
VSSWYLRSLSDHDTHKGELRPDGTMLALCGVQFEPRPLPLGRIALPGHPQDPEQICAKCRAAGGTR